MSRGEGAGDGDEAPPQLSVVIACWNAASTLGAQLSALAAQPCPVSWELLVCDNGSTDASVALAGGFRERLPGLRIIDASAERGAGPARNHGVRAARGEWVAFCDADDVVASDWLATMCAALAEHPFVAGRFESRRLNGARVLRSRPLQQQDELQRSEVGGRLPHAGGGNLGIHRATFLAVGGFDPTIRWLEDTDFSWRVQLAGTPLVFRPEVVVHVRLRQTYRSMFVQGRQYGFAHAQLEHRYGPPPQAARPAEEPVPASGFVPSRDRKTVFDSLIDHVIGGRLFWRLGWSLGHRTRIRSAAPAGRQTTGSHLPTA